MSINHLSGMKDTVTGFPGTSIIIFAGESTLVGLLMVLIIRKVGYFRDYRISDWS